MATHWKLFLGGWAACVAVLWAFPVGVVHVDQVNRAASAIGGSLTFLVPALIGAGIGRKTRYGTAAGMANGAIISVILLGFAMYSRVAA